MERYIADSIYHNKPWERTIEELAETALVGLCDKANKQSLLGAALLIAVVRNC